MMAFVAGHEHEEMMTAAKLLMTEVRISTFDAAGLPLFTRAALALEPAWNCFTSRKGLQREPRKADPLEDHT
jgi:hypothetical protein